MSMIAAYFQTFEETLKTAYSHGLEDVYALENVDLRSVRPLTQHTKHKKVPVERQPQTEFSNDQYEFDFGIGYRDWINSFVVKEPIAVLELSRHAETILLEHDISTLEHLLNLSQPSFLNKIGQGHWQDVQHRLALYIKNKPLKKSYQIDFHSWVICLTASLDRRQAYLLLEDHGLQDLISLNPLEAMEVSRIPLEKCLEWKAEALDGLQSPSQVEMLHRALREVSEAFLKPWMRSRKGMATQYELIECLQCHSDHPSLVKKALQFFTAILNEFPFARCLVSQELYFADQNTKEQFEIIVNQALSYFYKANLCYTLAELKSFLAREFAKQWKGFPEGLIEAAVRHSPCFRVRKAASGALTVRLA